MLNPNMVLTDYVPYNGGILFTAKNNSSGPLATSAAVQFFDGSNFVPFNNPDVGATEAIIKVGENIYVSGADAFDATAPRQGNAVYQLVGTAFVKVSGDDIFSKDNAPASMTGLAMLNGNLYFMGDFNEFNDENGNFGMAKVQLLTIFVPTAIQDTYTLLDTETKEVDVRDNDLYQGSDELSVVILEQASIGTATLNLDGTISYEAQLRADDYEDSLYYSVCNDGNSCDEAWAYFNVEHEKQNPDLQSDYATTEDGVSVRFNVLDNDDMHLDDAFVTIFEDGQKGTTIVHPDNTLEYTPNEFTYGSDSLQYQVCTEHGKCSQAWVYVEVDLENETPLAYSDTASVLSRYTLVYHMDNDIELDDEDVTFNIVEGPFNQDAAMVIRFDRVIYDNPNHDDFVADSVRYELCDPYGFCGDAWIYFQSNNPVVAVNDTIGVINNNTQVLFLDNDYDMDGEPLFGEVTVGPSLNGAFGTSCGDGCYDYYNPDPANMNRDSVQYYVYDHFGWGRSAWIYFHGGAYDPDNPNGTGGGVGLSEMTSTNNLDLYPIPANQQLNFKWKEEQTGSIEVLSLNGQVLMQTTLEGQSMLSMDVNALAPGNYLVRIRTELGVGVRKFVKG